MSHDDITNAAGAAIADVRMRLLEGWFGRGFERGSPSDGPGWDPVLDAKSFPDKIDDKAMLQGLEADHALSIESGWTFPEEPARDRDGPGHDLDR